MERPVEGPPTRRQFLKGAAALAVLGTAGAGAGVAIWRSGGGDGGAQTAGQSASGPVGLDRLAESVVSGGPGKDGIPSIDRPHFVPASQARFLRGEDVVFGIAAAGDVRAYPQLILVWHEIVNDAISGRPVSVTYCPLTGSVVAFHGRARGRPLEFGTTGNLVNSNLLMYDRVSDSEWPQLLGQAISGSQKGAPLEETPLVWTTWHRWRRTHPDTRVLSTKTGFSRSYGDDPYGSYTPLGGYYQGGGPIFPVLEESARFDAKEVVVGVKAGEARLAVLKRRIRESRVLPLQAGSTPLVALWDRELDTARVFTARAGGRTLRFEEGESRDATGSAWSAAGRATEGPLAGTQLRPATFLDAMWFAWYAFYPDTQVAA
jgi:hypothetical protein